jgi:hypothetical protein
MTVGRFESRIGKVEGFNVRMLACDGRDIRSDCGLKSLSYGFKKAAKGSDTVAQWRARRLKNLVGVKVMVLDPNGCAVHGRVTLDNLRVGY